MKIFFASSEMTPYAKTGGLGDVVGALPGELRELGHEVTCCLPFYRGAQEVARDAKSTGLILQIPLGSRTVTGEVLELQQSDGVRVLFIRRDEFFDRSELYYDGVHDYEDNAERFLFFSKAVVELLGHTAFHADVVHCHDWPTAFVPVQLAYRKNNPAQAGTLAPLWVKSVFTIHNIAYQGIFRSPDFSVTNLPREFFTMETLEFYGQMNLMKGGILFADAVTTVSRKYAQEIQTAAGGFGLDTVLATRAEHVQGIVNGVDYAQWNPATDLQLRQRYTPEDLSGKRACRLDLLAKLRLEAGETQPVAAFVSRLTEQKGVEVLAGAIEKLVKSGLRLIVLGKGERKYEELLTGIAKKFPGRVAVKIAMDEELSHQIQGGVDMLLVPSHFEPCGLTQLYAFKYGTIPVVRATGGLDDTVREYNPQSEDGTGFKFAPYTSAGLVKATQQAILLHKQPRKWQKLMRNAMARDFSWRASAQKYEKLYVAL
jgi:starch synthase